jgi:putative membrane protein
VTVSDLPLLNASLNGLSTIFILAGWWFIRHERKRAHIACMLTALCTSTAFLTSYLTYHWLKAGHVTEFTHPGWAKVIYLTILWTHIPLAGLTVVLVIVTVIPALRARYDRHKRIGRWTMPVWLYVSVTGVLVYMMLYQWFPPVRA